MNLFHSGCLKAWALRSVLVMLDITVYTCSHRGAGVVASRMYAVRFVSGIWEKDSGLISKSWEVWGKEYLAWLRQIKKQRELEWNIGPPATYSKRALKKVILFKGSHHIHLAAPES